MDQVPLQDPPRAAEISPVSPPVSNNLRWLNQLPAWWREWCEFAYDRARLAALETQRVGESLVAILIYGIVIGVLVVSAWLGAAGLLAHWLIQHGLGINTALLTIVVLNGTGAYGFALAIRRKSRLLCYPATIASFKLNRDTAQTGEPA